MYWLGNHSYFSHSTRPENGAYMLENHSGQVLHMSKEGDVLVRKSLMSSNHMSKEGGVQIGKTPVSVKETGTGV